MVVNLLAALYAQIARRELEARGLSSEKFDAPPTVATSLESQLRLLPLNDARRIFLAEFSNRATLNYELAQPRYSQDQRVDDFALASLRNAIATKSAVIQPSDAPMEPKLVANLSRAGRFETLKEDAKHHVLCELAVLRDLIVAVGERFGLGGDVFYLTLDEIEAISESGYHASLLSLAKERRKDTECFIATGILPVSLTLRDLETFAFDRETKSKSMGLGLLKGLAVSGSPQIEGRARVIAPADAELVCDLGKLDNDTIVVSRLIHPRWLTEVSGARALLCEIGGWLSHTAILAREYDVPMIVGIKSLDTIADGVRIRLHSDGSIERLAEVA